MWARGFFLLLIVVLVGCQRPEKVVSAQNDAPEPAVLESQGEWEVIGVEEYKAALTSDLGLQYLHSKSDDYEGYAVFLVKPPAGTEKSSIALRLKANGKEFYSNICHIWREEVVPVFVCDGVPPDFEESAGEVFLTEKGKDKQVVGRFRVANYPVFKGEIFDEEVKEFAVLSGGEKLEVLGESLSTLPPGVVDLRLTAASADFLYRLKPRTRQSSFAPDRPVSTYATLDVSDGHPHPLTVAYGRHQAAEKVKVEIQVDRQRRDDLVFLNIDGIKILKDEDGHLSGLDFTQATIRRDPKSTRAPLPNGQLEFALPDRVISATSREVSFSLIEPETGDGLQGQRFKGYSVSTPLGQPRSVQCSYGDNQIRLSFFAIGDQLPDTLSLVVINSREFFDSETVELVVRSPGYDGAYWTTTYADTGY